MSETLTKLQPGHIVLFGGARYRVTMVNESRARIEPLERVPAQVEQIIDGKKVVVATFSRQGVSQNISPNSEIPIVGYQKPEETEIKTNECKKPAEEKSVIPGSESSTNPPRRGRGRPRKAVAVR